MKRHFSRKGAKTQRGLGLGFLAQRRRARGGMKIEEELREECLSVFPLRLRALVSLRETNPSPRSLRLCASYFDVFDFVAAVFGAGGRYSSVTRLR